MAATMGQSDSLRPSPVPVPAIASTPPPAASGCSCFAVITKTLMQGSNDRMDFQAGTVVSLPYFQTNRGKLHFACIRGCIWLFDGRL